MRNRYLKSMVYRLASSDLCSELFWRSTARGLRILAYHGICRDDRVGALPEYFLKQSVFEQQLQYLSRNATVMKLSEAICLLRRADLPERALSITFDDGYANNLNIAAPLLERHRMPATIFLATAYIQSGEFFPFDRVRLLQHITQTDQPSLEDYRSQSIDAFNEQCLQSWSEWHASISDEQREALRPLTVQELKQFPHELVDFGAHSHTHCILRNESRPRREEEIVRSVELVRSWTGKTVFAFSFPNGEVGDFDERDKSLLRELDVRAAVTAIPGRNHAGSDTLELRRYSVGSADNNLDAFIARVAGLREWIKPKPPAVKRHSVEFRA